MTQWLAGMRITAARLNDFTPIALTSTATARTGFTVASFSAWKAGGTTNFAVILTYSGDIVTSSSSGNIGDLDCLTLPPDCRPRATNYGAYDKSGTASGAVRYLASGLCTLTTLDPTATIQSGNTINFSGAFATG
ncbi:hypothetical protein [Streptomyces sp. NPDC059278]|uniref:hypothetical protein n=1 Tax=Streptomyces sp. NPDC059278 TaxID=3346801 RepID=UPI0036803B17